MKAKDVSVTIHPVMTLTSSKTLGTMLLGLLQASSVVSGSVVVNLPSLFQTFFQLRMRCMFKAAIDDHACLIRR